MPLPELALESVTERDIDLLLLEELSTSPDFARWLALETGFAVPEGAELIGAWHSVVDGGLGESDLIVVWQASCGSRTALLIENKIDARAMPNQGKRYRLRGEAGIDDSTWRSFYTCMVAPSRYLESSKDKTEYDGSASYEDIRGRLLSAASACERAKFRASILTAAIDQQRRGYSAKIDDHVTEFLYQFWRASLEGCPRLRLQEPTPTPARARWIRARPPELGGVQLVIKLHQGFVDLQINGAVNHAERIDALCLNHFESIRGVETGKSTAVRIEVVPVDVEREFDDQHDAIEAVFEAAENLFDAWAAIGDEIQTIVRVT